jgi:hypothetical protein
MTVQARKLRRIFDSLRDAFFTRGASSRARPRAVGNPPHSDRCNCLLHHDATAA